MASNPDFQIEYEEFHNGLAPLAHLDKNTLLGNSGQASEMSRVDVISQPGVLKQGPGLSQLTNGNVDELIEFIMDRSINEGESYGIGESKLYKLIPGEVVDDLDFPRDIPNCVEGESVIDLNGNLFYFYNKETEGDIGTYENFSSFNDTWGSNTDKPLQKALHPTAKKEDILVFGNGRYLGTYIEGLGILDTEKLDFGEGSEVADVVFHANSWYIAVNSGAKGDNRNSSQIYMYDGSAISNLLTDEAAVGVQRIGFLFTFNGIIYVAYEDLTSDGYSIGYLTGRSIEPLRYFEGSLPTHKQKTLYKNTILFNSGEDIYSCGASVSSLPNQISAIAKGEYETLGALAAPFGTPIIASKDSTSASVDMFSGYTTESRWVSIATRVTTGKMLGQVDTLIVHTKPLQENSKCEIRVVGNEKEEESRWFEISGKGKKRHLIKSIDVHSVVDFNIEIKWEAGSETEDCPIRNIIALGHYVEN